jgi:tetratricopeptide (TPR) repeat protein
MSLLDLLLGRKKPESKMPTAGQKTAETPIQPQESEATPLTKDTKEHPTVAKPVSEQREVVIEGKKSAAPSPKDYVNEGVDIYQKGDYQGALSKFKAATELDPTMAAAWSNIGCALGQLGDCDGALEAFATALEIDPENKQAKEGKELCLKMQNAT